MFEKLFSIFIKDSKNTSDVKVRTAYGTFTGIVGILSNALLFLLKAIIGFITGSVAVVADSFNNLSDATSNVISLFGFRLGSRPADEEHPYGHGRFEYLAGLSVAVLIMVIGVELIKSSVDKIINPAELLFSWYTVAILGFSILVKLFLMLLNNRAGKLICSNTLIATAKDSRNDVISTSAVLISIILYKYLNIDLDAYIGLAVALFILISGFNIIKETIGPLLGKAPDEGFVESVKEKVLSYEGILGIHDLMVHDYGPGRLFASVHAEMSSTEDPFVSHEIIDKIEKEVFEDMGLHLVIHYDPIAVNDTLVMEMSEFLDKSVKTIDEQLSVHDIRIVKGVERYIAVFDLVIPFSVKLNQKEIKERLALLVKESYPKFDINVTVDRTYASTACKKDR